MDQKQFELLQQEIQWVVDEARRKAAHQSTKAVAHDQQHWSVGRVSRNSETVKIEKSGPFVDDTWLQLTQPMVVCATSCCLAGGAVVSHGDRIVVFNSGMDLRMYGTSSESRTVAAEFCVDSEGTLHSISHRAQELMGLTGGEASFLFSGGHSAESLRVEATKIAAKHGFHLEII
jgi:hypothetical protein